MNYLEYILIIIKLEQSQDFTRKHRKLKFCLKFMPFEKKFKKVTKIISKAVSVDP